MYVVKFKKTTSSVSPAFPKKVKENKAWSNSDKTWFRIPPLVSPAVLLPAAAAAVLTTSGLGTAAATACAAAAPDPAAAAGAGAITYYPVKAVDVDVKGLRSLLRREQNSRVYHLKIEMAAAVVLLASDNSTLNKKASISGLVAFDRVLWE